MCKNGKLSNIKDIGTYYYDDKVNKTNGEFDILLDHGKEYTIFESKYLKNKMPLSLIHHEIDQIKSIKKIQIKNIGFISMNGFEKKEDGYYYIDGEDLHDFWRM